MSLPKEAQIYSAFQVDDESDAVFNPPIFNLRSILKALISSRLSLG